MTEHEDVEAEGTEPLVVNISGMAVAGWLTLVLQQTLWRHASLRRDRFAVRLRRTAPHGPHAGPPRA